MAVLTELIAIYGPWLLFVMAVGETCFPLGILVPSGTATAFAAVLASSGAFAWEAVPAAAIAGGFTGDMLGWGIGTAWGDHLRRGEGRVSQALRRNESKGRFVGRHPVYSVTVARMVPFARSLMPVSIGMARMPLARYVLYEVPGLLVWAALYIGIGLLAGESWQKASSIVGVGWTGIFVVVGLILWRRARRRGEWVSEVPDP